MTQRNDSSTTRKLGPTRRVCVTWLLLLAGGWASVSVAADPPSTPATPAAAKPAAEKPAADKPAPQKPAEDAAKADVDDEDIKPPPVKPGKSAGSPQRFEPSEQVRPDFDVSFPIDI